MSVVLTSAYTFAAAVESILRRTRSTERYALKDSTDIYEKIVDIEKVLGASRNEEQTEARDRQTDRQKRVLGLRSLFSILPLASGFFLNRFIFGILHFFHLLFCSVILFSENGATKNRIQRQKQPHQKTKKSSFTSSASSSSGPPELISL
jgi:hypothetical protein